MLKTPSAKLTIELKKLKALTHKRIMLLIGFALSLITMLLSQTPLQDLVSSNTTVIYIKDVTRMPFWFLIGLVVLVIVIFVYLWVEAGEDDDIDKLNIIIGKLEKKLDKRFKELIKEVKALRNDLKGE